MATKAGIYADTGIPEYWLFRADDRAIDVYRDSSRGDYRTRVTLKEPGMLHSAGLPEREIALADIFPPR